jgi:hypothetical protein
MLETKTRRSMRQEGEQPSWGRELASSHSSGESPDLRRRPSPQMLREQEEVQGASSALARAWSHSSGESPDLRRRPSPQMLREQEEVQGASSALARAWSHSSPGSRMPSPQEGSGAEVEGAEEASVVESVEEVEGSVVTAAEVLVSAEVEEVGSEWSWMCQCRKSR